MDALEIRPTPSVGGEGGGGIFSPEGGPAGGVGVGLRVRGSTTIRAAPALGTTQGLRGVPTFIGIPAEVSTPPSEVTSPGPQLPPIVPAPAPFVPQEPPPGSPFQTPSPLRVTPVVPVPSAPTTPSPTSIPISTPIEVPAPAEVSIPQPITTTTTTTAPTTTTTITPVETPQETPLPTEDIEPAPEPIVVPLVVPEVSPQLEDVVKVREAEAVRTRIRTDEGRRLLPPILGLEDEVKTEDELGRKIRFSLRKITTEKGTVYQIIRRDERNRIRVLDSFLPDYIAPVARQGLRTGTTTSVGPVSATRLGPAVFRIQWGSDSFVWQPSPDIIPGSVRIE
jgi:hypothetical protein